MRPRPACADVRRHTTRTPPFSSCFFKRALTNSRALTPIMPFTCWYVIDTASESVSRILELALMSVGRARVGILRARRRALGRTRARAPCARARHRTCVPLETHVKVFARREDLFNCRAPITHTPRTPGRKVSERDFFFGCWPAQVPLRPVVPAAPRRWTYAAPRSRPTRRSDPAILPCTRP